MTFVVGAERDVPMAPPCLLPVCRNMLAKHSLFSFPLFCAADSAVVSLPGAADMIQAEDWLLMLIISVTRVDLRVQLWLLP